VDTGKFCSGILKNSRLHQEDFIFQRMVPWGHMQVLRLRLLVVLPVVDSLERVEIG
jgi:hypothetical protein